MKELKARVSCLKEAWQEVLSSMIYATYLKLRADSRSERNIREAMLTRPSKVSERDNTQAD